MGVGKIILPVIIPLGIVLGISSCNRQAVEAAAELPNYNSIQQLTTQDYLTSKNLTWDSYHWYFYNASTEQYENHSLETGEWLIPLEIEYNWNGSAYDALGIRYAKITSQWSYSVAQTLACDWFALINNGHSMHTYYRYSKAPHESFTFSGSLGTWSEQNYGIFTVSAEYLGITLSGYQWKSWLNLYLQSIANAGDLTEQAWETGYQDGYDEGMASGLAQGYREGQNSVSTEATAIMGLFGGIANVPIQILNGLAPMVIWNTPIVYIIVSLMMFALILTLIERVIHGS